jgi:hypothetical protein
MEKRTLYALLAVLAVGALALAVQRSPEKGQRKGPPPRPVAELKAADIAKLELTNEKQEHTTLEKASPTEWRVKQPGDWKADQSGVKQLLDALGKLGFADTVTENVEKQAELGVADGKGAHIVVKDAGGKTLADLLIGKSVGGFTMVRVAGHKEVWQATGLFPYTIAREPKAWRDHTVFDFALADVEKLTVESPGQKLVLEKLPADKDKPGDNQWKIVESEGAAPKTADALDAHQANASAQGMSNLHAADFADDKKKEDVIGKGQALTLTAMAKGQAHTLYIGEQKGDDLYVATAESPTVYIIKKYALDRIARRPIDFRDKTLAKIKAADLTSVEITVGAETTTLTQKDGKWSAGKATVDDAKVKPVVASFENFSADGFSDERDPVKTGLGKPAGQVVAHSKDKQTVTIKVGAATKDGDYYVTKIGSPDVYRVKKYAVDRWLKKPADLTKK